jgi:hypothetical protein
VSESETKIKKWWQFWIMLAAVVLDYLWLALPGWALLVGGAVYGSIDGALGKQYGLFLAIALGIAATMLWAPWASKISLPLIRKLAQRLDVTGKEK